MIEKIRYTPHRLQLFDAAERCFEYDAWWLRDSCACSQCRDPASAQRLFDITDLPTPVEIAHAELQGTAVVIRFAIDAHETRFGGEQLLRCNAQPFAVDRVLWDAQNPVQFPRIEFRHAQTKRGELRSWLGEFCRYGMGFVSGVPHKNAAVCDMAELFGFVRETNYGRYFDVRSKPNPHNLAYTTLALGPHTDNPYRDPVPGLQLLHCLVDESSGGESIVVDGFQVAERLRATSPCAFELLTRYAVPFQFIDQQVNLYARHKLIELDDRGQLAAICYNNRSVASLDVPLQDMDEFYRAYHHYASLLQHPEFQIRFKLVPGELFMVDNQRVLHGRSQFAIAGMRHLQGCYADKDALASEVRIAFA